MWIIMQAKTDKSEISVMTGQSPAGRILSQIICLTAIFVSVFGLSATQASDVRITRIYDGDTLTLSTGETIRLLQIDAPELRGGECYAVQAQKELAKILSKKGKIGFKTDPKIETVDIFGRSLRYVFVGKTNVNLKLVEVGAATPYFYKGELGKFSDQLLKAAKRAKLMKKGLWQFCPETKLNPYKSASTGSTRTTLAPNPEISSTAECDPNYLACIPFYPPDLNCSDIISLGLAPVRVIGNDVHKLDRDGDGIGCDN